MYISGSKFYEYFKRSQKHSQERGTEGLKGHFSAPRRVGPILRKLVMELHLPSGYYEDRRRKRNLLASEDLLLAQAMLSTWAVLPEDEIVTGRGE